MNVGVGECLIPALRNDYAMDRGMDLGGDRDQSSRSGSSQFP